MSEAISQELIEQLARKVHQRWAEKRISEGWVYGEQRNDQLKETPCLVPYDELSEIEKDYDRATAQETLSSLSELGYSIVKDK